MTIEELKQHCINTIKMSETIESIPNVRVTDNRSLQEHKMVLKLIEAWEKVKEEIETEIRAYDETVTFHRGVRIGLKVADEFIDKHLKEIEVSE